MAYQANIGITVGKKKYRPGDEIDKIGDVAARWLLQEGYISESAKEKAAEKEVVGNEKPSEQKSSAKGRTKKQQKADSGKDSYV